MKFKTRTIAIVAGMALASPCYHIAKAIYHNGIIDGKANAHKVVVVKK